MMVHCTVRRRAGEEINELLGVASYEENSEGGRAALLAWFIR
jgi:hypothetical protein